MISFYVVTEFHLSFFGLVDKPVKARSRGVIFYDEDLKRWQSPFFMETINGKIVRRSQSLLGSLYGDKFVYK